MSFWFDVALGATIFICLCLFGLGAWWASNPQWSLREKLSRPRPHRGCTCGCGCKICEECYEDIRCPVHAEKIPKARTV